MTHTRTSGKPDPGLETVAATVGRLGEATAAAIAAAANVPYSTTNKKLRALETAGRAEAFKADDTRTMWRLTDAGRAAVTGAAGQTEPDPPAVDAQPGAPTTDAGSDTADDAGHDCGGEDAAAASADDETVLAAPVVGATDGGSGTQPGHGAATPHRQPDTGQHDETSGPDDGDSDGPDTGPAAADASTPIGGEPPQRARPPTPDGTAGSQPGTADHPSTTDGRSTKARRGKGSLRDAVLKILQDHPDTQYKVGELCKLVDAANAGTGAAKASAGAVANALDKLVGDGSVHRTVDKPATFQAA